MARAGPASPPRSPLHARPVAPGPADRRARPLPSTSSGSVSTTASDPVGATALAPPGPAPPPMRSTRSLAVRNSLWTTAGPSISPVGRDQAQRRGVARERLPGLDLALRVGLAIVQGEGQRQRSGVRRQRDAKAGRPRRCRIARRNRAAAMVRPLPRIDGHCISGGSRTGAAAAAGFGFAVELRAGGFRRFRDVCASTTAEAHARASRMDGHARSIA